MTIRILAIDDSPTMRGLIAAALEPAGFEVHLAEDGIDGLDRLPAADPHLVITDINMPRMDGFGVITAVRASTGHASLPILVLTTETGAELKQRARSAGATGWIVKPFDPPKLVKALHIARHAGRLTQNNVNRHVDRACFVFRCQIGNPWQTFTQRDTQLAFFSSHTHNRVGATFTASDDIETGQVLRQNRQHVAFLCFVAPDFSGRQPRLFEMNLSKFKNSAATRVVDEFGEGIG